MDITEICLYCKNFFLKDHENSIYAGTYTIENGMIYPVNFLKVGQYFYIHGSVLNNGVYHGKTIVSEKYLKRATTPGKCDPQYGFLFWINPDGFSMSGYGGQHVYVIPDQQRVIVTQATPTSRPMAYFDLLAFLSDHEPVRQGR